ncbi:MAG: enoyl-CoA hydratase/isomerase family protein [Dehalococcoidia bacterium]
MDYQNILLDKDTAARVAVITLNRAEKMNALSQALWADLEHALRDCDGDTDVRAIILTGAGRAFSAGADMSSDPRQPAQQRGLVEWWEAEGKGLQRHRLFREMTKPIVAAVNGWCMAWGLEVASMCDFIIASDQARFGAPEIRHGSTVNTFMTWNLGPQWARYLLLSGETIDAHTAERIKLALRVVPHDDLMGEARRFAARLAMIPPIAMQLNKRMLDSLMNIAGLDVGLELGRAMTAIAHTLQYTAETPDGRNLEEIRQQHGLKAFLEARDAPFRE